MKAYKKLPRSVILIAISVFLISMMSACDIDQTQEGKLPEVEVKEGQLPKYDVETADVEVKSKEVEITVPDVDITMPDEKKPE